MTARTILDAIKVYEDELIAIRRDFHAHPEIGFEEHRTANRVAELLRSWGIEAHEGVGRTGVVGTLKGRRPGQRAVALRADMDALYIDERSDLPYRSTVPGKMHACGHDGHTTMLLGAARYLAENRDFGGTVHFFFQPAEEGLGGAQAMIEDGLFERFPVDAVYGMHNKPGWPVGEFGLRPGPMFAASDTWTVTFKGSGGHGGSGAHKSTDPTLPLGHFILAVQAIIGRDIPAVEPAVLSIGHISAGAFGAPSIIPAEVLVRGTARSYSASIRDILERRLREVTESIADVYGCCGYLQYKRGSAPLINTPEQTEIATSAATDLVGQEHVDTGVPRKTAGEDFGAMLERKPGAYILIGNGVEPDGSFRDVHTPIYDFNDEILCLGAAYWAGLVNRELGCGSDA